MLVRCGPHYLAARLHPCRRSPLAQRRTREASGPAQFKRSERSEIALNPHRATAAAPSMLALAGIATATAAAR
jgi:hypothetical protein